MYRKNVASQFVCFQMLLTATGAVATGLSPAVRRCIDGTFAAGGGTVTEDGTTGSYKYAMSQADTNGNDISFIFSAATAMPVCVNIVTTAADPTDSVRLGLTGLANAVPGTAGGLFIAGSNAATSITTALTANITGNITGNLSGSVGSVTGAVGSISANGIAAASFAAGAIDATAIANGAIDAATFAAGAIDATAIANGAIDAATFAAGAIDAAAIATGAVDADALATDAVVEIADGLLNRDMATGTDSGSSTVRTVRQALRFLRNKWTTVGIDATTATLTVTKEDDAATSWTAVVTSDSAAHPIIANDPAGP